MASNTEYKSWLSSEDDTIVSLEKAQSGRTTLDDISDALDEYKRLFIAGLASPGEVITLHRAYPDNEEYAEACLNFSDDDDEEKVMIVGGPASVEVVDREGHLITTDALKKAFKKYMDNFRGRNVMVMHSDVQVGHALPAYISKAGNIFKSGVDDKGLFFISELRDDTKIANRVRDQIKKGGMSSYSIAGSATKSKEINKSDGSHILQVDDMELAEVTICEKGVNQNAHFKLLKGDKAEGSCVDGSCLTKSHDPAPDYNIIAISKSEMPSFKDMFTSWITKEKDSDKSRAVAIATAQAKKEGYKKFTEGSPGDDRRDKIAEAIKDSAKSAKEKAILKTFLTKQPQDYGGFAPGTSATTRSKKAPPPGPGQTKDQVTPNVSTITDSFEAARSFLDRVGQAPTRNEPDRKTSTTPASQPETGSNVSKPATPTPVRTQDGRYNDQVQTDLQTSPSDKLPLTFANSPSTVFYDAKAPEGQKYQEYGGGQFYVTAQPPEGMSPDEVQEQMDYDGSSFSFKPPSRRKGYAFGADKLEEEKSITKQLFLDKLKEIV